MIKRRRRFKHTITLTDRLASYALKYRERAASLPECDERAELERKAFDCEHAIVMERLLTAHDLRPPT